MSKVGIHALPLTVVYLCSIVVIKDHSPYSSRQLLGEISRCGRSKTLERSIKNYLFDHHVRSRVCSSTDRFGTN